MDLLQMSLSGSVLILAIILIRACTLHLLPKRTFLVLWAIAALRLVVPYSISSKLSIFSLFAGAQASHVSETFHAFTTSQVPFQMPTAVTDLNMVTQTAQPLLSGYELTWLIGFCLFAGFFVALHLKSRREFKTSLPLAHPKAARWLSQHPLRRSLQIRYLDRISVPLTYGIFKPVILLSKEMDWKNEMQLQYILMHEYIHIRRFDAVLKAILAVLLCLHWFNPLVWCMHVLANRDIELACDEAVVHALGQEKKEEYALTLIDLAASNCSSAPLINHFSKNVMEERIKSIMKTKKIRLMSIILAAVLVVGAVVVFATSPAISETPTYPTVRIEDRSNTIQWMDNQQLQVSRLFYQHQNYERILTSLENIENSLAIFAESNSDELNELRENIFYLKEETRLLQSSYTNACTELQDYADTYNSAELSFYQNQVIPQLIENDIVSQHVAEANLDSLEHLLSCQSFDLSQLPPEITAAVEYTNEKYLLYSFALYSSAQAVSPYYTLYYFRIHNS